MMMPQGNGFNSRFGIQLKHFDFILNVKKQNSYRQFGLKIINYSSGIEVIC